MPTAYETEMHILWCMLSGRADLAEEHLARLSSERLENLAGTARRLSRRAWEAFDLPGRRQARRGLERKMTEAVYGRAERTPVEELNRTARVAAGYYAVYSKQREEVRGANICWACDGIDGRHASDCAKMAHETDEGAQ